MRNEKTETQKTWNYIIRKCISIFLIILVCEMEETGFCSFDVKLYRFENFVDFASQLRCHRQKVGLQLLVHEEKNSLSFNSSLASL